MEWIIVPVALIGMAFFFQRPSLIRDRESLTHSLKLEGWLDARHALRFNETDASYELLDFIRWNHDTKDGAHCLYHVNEIRCGRERKEAGCENDCMLVLDVEGTERTILLDRRFDFDCSGFCSHRG